MEGIIGLCIKTICCGVICSFLATYLAKKIRLFDIPNQRKIHKEKILQSGGIFIFSSFFSSILLNGLLKDYITPIFVGSFLFLLIGIIDDKLQLSARVKLILQTFIISIIVAFFKVQTYIFQNQILDFYLSLFLFLGFINAINLIDGIDGLAGSFVFILSITLALAGFLKNNQLNLYFFILSLIMVLFLLQNLFGIKNKIFLGDNGTMLLGFLLSSLHLKSNGCDLVWLFVLLIPSLLLVIETIYTITRRIKNKRPIFLPDKSHIHHRLLEKGLLPFKIVLIFSIVTLFLSTITLLFICKI